jgi:hypothetical protein
MKLNTVTVAVLIIGATVTLVALFHGGDRFEALLFAVLALAPYAAFFASCRLARTRGRALATLIVSSLATAYAALVYIDAMFIHPGGMAGLVFIFVPLYQLIAALILLAVLFFTRARNARNA